ncbi:hypothetical protein F5X68DRAFT_202514 [Plectosphaerella plurivora]|uniref:Uncharacterized protein n=1 Tax=Plectosphaerella plurivora TaxID=936078 RepID=A0A9P9AEQ0_9PEZI|nr:hypothetical protein F5X68DRAFT_202514 [Plectosphaerella plurivora]
MQQITNKTSSPTRSLHALALRDHTDFVPQRHPSPLVPRHDDVPHKVGPRMAHNRPRRVRPACPARPRGNDALLVDNIVAAVLLIAVILVPAASATATVCAAVGSWGRSQRQVRRLLGGVDPGLASGAAAEHPGHGLGAGAASAGAMRAAAGGAGGSGSDRLRVGCPLGLADLGKARGINLDGRLLTTGLECLSGKAQALPGEEYALGLLGLLCRRGRTCGRLLAVEDGVKVAGRRRLLGQRVAVGEEGGQSGIDGVPGRARRRRHRGGSPGGGGRGRDWAESDLRGAESRAVLAVQTAHVVTHAGVHGVAPTGAHEGCWCRRQRLEVESRRRPGAGLSARSWGVVGAHFP